MEEVRVDSRSTRSLKGWKIAPGEAPKRRRRRVMVGVPRTRRPCLVTPFSQVLIFAEACCSGINVSPLKLCAPGCRARRSLRTRLDLHHAGRAETIGAYKRNKMIYNWTIASTLASSCCLLQASSHGRIVSSPRTFAIRTSTELQDKG